MRVHGIDTGANFGFATLEMDGSLVKAEVIVEQKKSTKRSHVACWAMHLQAIRALMIEAIQSGDVVAFEAVRFSTSLKSAHAYGRVIGVVEEVCYLKGIEPVEVGVSTAKVEAVGHGCADKQDMIEAMVKRWNLGIITYITPRPKKGDKKPAVVNATVSGPQRVITEHEADAAWIAETARRGKA